jgi:hypothetical protein
MMRFWSSVWRQFRAGPSLVREKVMEREIMTTLAEQQRLGTKVYLPPFEGHVWSTSIERKPDRQ